MTGTTMADVATVGGAGDASELTSEIVERRPAARARVSSIASFCVLRAKRQDEDEFRVPFRKTESASNAIMAAILQLHLCELPAIHASAMERAFEPYRDWIVESVAREGDET